MEATTTPGRPPPALPRRIAWAEGGTAVRILDQTALPAAEVERELRTLEDVEEAIRSLRVRGAPLIGITAAMGVAALARQRLVAAGGAPSTADAPSLARDVLAWCDRLERARPTAVNLTWALARMRQVADRAVDHATDEPTALADALTAEADRILDEDRRTCRRIGEHALGLLEGAGRVLTHCNAGALATGGIGTALAPVYLALERGRPLGVLVGETRPLLQGSRLTAWELGRAGVDVTVATDDAAGALFAHQRPDAVLVGADRIAANGDTANKIGTYGLAVLARHHGVPFYVLAPTSTVDLATADGAAIPIEERSPDEVRRGFGVLTAPEGARIWSPAFDVTPAELITAVVTEEGVHRPPYGPALGAAVAAAEAHRGP